MNIHHIIECSSPDSATFDILLSTSHLVLYFIHKFYCVTSHGESFGICPFLGINFLKSPNHHESSLRTLRYAHFRREEVLHDDGQLVASYPRSFRRFPWSIVGRSSTFPLLRRPRSTIILFWITWWWRLLRFPRSIVTCNRLSRILISIRGHPRLWWSWRRHDRRHSCGQIHHGSRFGCDTFVSWSLLSSFCHCSGASCRTEMANV